jgi:hypothetical protein
VINTPVIGALLAWSDRTSSFSTSVEVLPHLATRMTPSRTELAANLDPEVNDGRAMMTVSYDSNP